MLDLKDLYGTGVALVTPFDEEGQIDFSSLSSLITHCIKGGVDYFVVLGTTAETATLTKDEKSKVIDFIVSEAGGKTPLVLGIGGNNTELVSNEIQSDSTKYFDAILSVSPYYNKPSQEGIYHHYKTLSSKTEKPIIIYNVPGRTSSNIAAETVLRLSKDCENIIGTKEASGCMVQNLNVLKSVSKDFLVVSGDDMTALQTVYSGGKGVISVLAQAFPKMFSDMINFGLEGKLNEANALHHRLMKSTDLIFEEGNPVGIKTLLKEMGIIKTNKVRLPLVEGSASLAEKLNFELKSILNYA